VVGVHAVICSTIRAAAIKEVNDILIVTSDTVHLVTQVVVLRVHAIICSSSSSSSSSSNIE
jgi:hypothetical protein